MCRCCWWRRWCRSVPFVLPVPNGVTAVLGTITVYSPSAFTTPFGAGGYAAVVPTGTAVAGVAVTFSAGQMFMSSLFVSALNAGGVDVYVQGSAAHITVDVIGYYA